MVKKTGKRFIGKITMATITKKEKQYLRDLAKKQMEYAHLDIMKERTRQWYEHNALCGTRPMLVMEMGTFQDSILLKPQCQSPAAQEIEQQLMVPVINHELIDDDKVVPDYFSVYWDIEFRLFDLEIEHQTVKDKSGRDLGTVWTHPITDIGSDLEKLAPSTQSVDRDGTLCKKAFVEDIIGDIMPVRLENRHIHWLFMPTIYLVYLMGMEYMLTAMIDTPDEFNLLLGRICDDLRKHLRWLEQENLLSLNNANDYVGSGSYGFTTELPTPEYRQTGSVTSKDVWGNINSQESVGISPAMYGEMIFPHYNKLAMEFGLLYYGCCEPVDKIWDDYLCQIPNLRKVSISPWCDEQMMGQRLCGTNVIYSRKPNPTLIGVNDFDESGYQCHIATTLKAAKGCALEIIHRDIYTLNGDQARAKRAIIIARRLIDQLWD